MSLEPTEDLPPGRALHDHDVRILSFDGGPGTLIDMAVLARLEEWCVEKHGASFVEQVDLFSGTSTGALAALYLATKLGDEVPGGEALRGCIQFTRDCADTARTGAPGLLGWLRTATRPAYDCDELRAVIEDHLGDRTLGEVKKNVAILGFDVARWAPVSFRNFEPASNEECSLLHVAVAVASLPLLLPTQVIRVGATWQENLGSTAPEDGWVNHPIIDGLAANNNPTWSAINQALIYRAGLGVKAGKKRGYFFGNYDDLKHFRLLSIGVRAAEREDPWADVDRSWLFTHYPRLARLFPFPLPEIIRSSIGIDRPGPRPMGMLQWTLQTMGFGFANLFIQGSSALEHESAKTLLGVEQYHRFHPEVPIWEVMAATARGTREDFEALLDERGEEIWEHEVAKLEALRSYEHSPEAQREMIERFELPVYGCRPEPYSSLLHWVPRYWLEARPCGGSGPGESGEVPV